MGLIFDIKRYAINDGPGIRTTVFMKGCPLSCVWCHNPEGVSSRKQKLYTKKKCIGCRTCVEKDVYKIQATTLRIAREFKNVVAVKEASGNITQMDDIIKNKPANFNVISGDDGITFPLITLGAIGVISVSYTHLDVYKRQT